MQSTRFQTFEQLLNFYESNRLLFNDASHFEKILTPLAGLSKHKRAEIKELDSKKFVPQIKLLANDFGKFVATQPIGAEIFFKLLE